LLAPTSRWRSSSSTRLRSSPGFGAGIHFRPTSAGTGPSRPSSVMRWPSRTCGFQPPSGRKKRYPSSETCVTTSPISSMCATRASNGPPPVPATRAREEPRASVETSANAAAASRHTRAGAASCPDGPGVASRSRSRSGSGIWPDSMLGGMRRLLLLLSAIMLVDTMFFSALTPLLPHYADTLGLSKAGAGVLTAAFGVGTLAGSVPSGLLAVRLGVKPTVLLGLGLLVATSLVFGFARSVVVLDVARFCQGFGGACTWTGSLAWLVSRAPRERRGELIG